MHAHDQDLDQDRPCKRPRHEPHHQQQESQSDAETPPTHFHDDNTGSDHPLSPQEENQLYESDQDPEDDIVLSDVHIHPDNGRVDGRVMTSTFLLSSVNQSTIKDYQEINKDEKDDDEPTWEHDLHIQHAMGTSLRN
ncbi:hypothetical protein BGZ93_000826, partial [Podila epicladia]